MSVLTVYRSLDPKNPLRVIARNLRSLLVDTSAKHALQERIDHCTHEIASLRGELDSSAKENFALRSEVARLTAAADAIALENGTLKTGIHDLAFWRRLYEWRYIALCREHWGMPIKAAEPVRDVPAELMPGYSMNGAVDVSISWGDETRPSNWPLVYTDDEINACLAMIQRREYSIYGMTDYWLWDAFAKLPITDKSIAIMGSISPWYESACIHFGGKPTTIEYNTIVVRSSRMEAITVAEQKKNGRTFDAAVSISSFEHDGLGRYGDPLDPDGDLKAMQQMKKVLRPGGLLFLALPIGTDRVIFNVARVYGHKRFPLLVDGWEIVDRFGWFDGILDSNGSVQPIIVLRNQGLAMQS
jgi:hypothetical protein